MAHRFNNWANFSKKTKSGRAASEEKKRVTEIRHPTIIDRGVTLEVLIMIPFLENKNDKPKPIASPINVEKTAISSTLRKSKSLRAFLRNDW
jgi:hypothetical protein